ncbi:SpoIIE family protein phosphatase [Nonomuraea rubra]|uniref:Serine phosphatase RsbU (Regulator of sigma subunit)/PAS domain-containing protein n=1 Tax=Nonomuraea rubra TaxID=46180 RepID=A0A7X0NWW4_9ACTN|nr:SpoIIE family protein phosphatase [Nonomuraea rubra]MBB6551127.1 serine phosphatase RsbU (regulator of sigma subunit)/PAS domain-containing protein [Nonomuraea rubra]
MADAGKGQGPMLSTGTSEPGTSPPPSMSGAHLTTALDETLVSAARATGAHIAALFLLDGTGQLLLMQAELGLPGPIVEPWSRMRAWSDTPVAAAVRLGERIWVPDPEELARRYPAASLLAPYHFAIMVSPISVDGQVKGCWALIWPAPRTSPGSPDGEVIDEVSRRLGELLRDSGPPVVVARPRVLAPPADAPPEPDAATAAAGFAERLRDGCVSVDLHGRVTYANPRAAELLGTSVPDLCGRVLWEAVGWLRDPYFKDRFRAAVVGQRLTSYTLTPPHGDQVEIRLHPGPSGVSLQLTRVEQGGLDQAGLEPDGLPASAHARGMHNLLHMAATLTSALTTHEVIDVVTAHMLPMCGVQAMTILVAEGGRMRIIGSHGCSAELLSHLDFLPLTSDGPVGDVARTGRPAFLGDGQDPGGRGLGPMPADGMAAWALLPLSFADRVIGVCVLAFDHPRHFAGAERATLTSLAGMMAQALDRALLYEAKDKMAHSLQSNLLPRRLPEIEGLETAARYTPATRGAGIGGDFYDLIRLHDKAAVAVIGDVQGHNMAAAALMGQVRTAIHTSVAANPDLGADPGAVLRHANWLLLDLDTELFTSCLIVHLDLRLRAFSAANAGHLPPLLRVPHGSAEPVDVPPGPLLGIDPDAEYHPVQVPFSPGAVLALYTDGLVERPDTHLGDAIAGLAAHLTQAADQPLHQLSETLLSCAPGDEQRCDDIALLLLKHEQPQP